MEFRKTIKTDIDEIMNIIGQAQALFREHGINQWQNGYPNNQAIRNDINNGSSYVLLKDGAIIGTAAIIFGVEKTYESIYNGEWLTNAEYVTIHRIAIDSKYKGLGYASMIFKKAEEMCQNANVHSIRVDTHEENLPMQKLLNKNNYKYCGIIYLDDGSKRLAFEKVL